MKEIKGFTKLTNHQKNFFNSTLKKHQSILGDSLKERYTPVMVKALTPNSVKVTFKNGDWLHYTSNHEWF